MSPPVQGGRALVVFSGRVDLWWLGLLRPGFRHCFVLVELGDSWVCVNPLAHRTSVEIWRMAAATDLLAWLRAQKGVTVVETFVRHPPRKAYPIGIYSCVEAVKRILGLHGRWVLTPGQLFDHLTECGKKSFTSAHEKNMIPKSTPEPCPKHAPCASEAGVHDRGKEQIVINF
jgi:hypothetical protein